jgi:hypothetical protein
VWRGPSAFRSARAGPAPAYPEERRWEAHLSDEERRTWRSAVARSFRHAAAAELRSVPAAARTAGQLFGPTDREGEARFRDLPLAILSSSAYGPKWSAWQDDLAGTSRWSVHLRTGDRSHNSHLRHIEVRPLAVATGALPGACPRRGRDCQIAAPASRPPSR